MQYLSRSCHGVKVIPASMLTLHPFATGKSQSRIYGTGKTEKGRFFSFWLEPSKEIRADLEMCYMPGGIYAHIYPSADGRPWLISFNAERILASVYCRMEQEDVISLVKEVFV